MNREDFVDPENWRGGPTYQLAMAWPAGDDRQLLSAIDALWKAPGIAGPWEIPSQYPEISPIVTALDREGGLKDYGLLILADQTEVGCIVFTTLKEKPYGTGTLDWLFVAIYRGMQQKAFDFVYSDRLRNDNPWLMMIDGQYLSLAERIYTAAPFAFAIVDFEGSALFEHSHELPDRIQPYGSSCLVHNSGI